MHNVYSHKNITVNLHIYMESREEHHADEWMQACMRQAPSEAARQTQRTGIEHKSVLP